MICCLNPDCQNPQNPDGIDFCQSCGTKIVLLRNRYRPIQPVGGGGFGRTYLAEDVDKLNEFCVIKQFAPQLQGSWAVQKATQLFEQEARRLQHLGEHPQIPTLLAYFKEDNYLYLMQQYIQGQTVDEELQQGAYSEQKIWELLLDLLNILEFVHEQGVIHRDIKPKNIIRRRGDGKLVLIDFGIAKQLTATTLAKTGTTIGSFGYVPIEQMQDGQAYRASDLFSLGATCFHLLTQIHPWELWKRQGYGWVSSWQQHLRQPVSQELEYILNQLLQENQEQRYQSAEAVLKDLIALNHPHTPLACTIDLPSLASTVTVPYQLSPPPPVALAKNPTKSKNTLLVGVAIMLLGIGGYGSWHVLNQNVAKTHLSAKTDIYEKLALANTLTGHTQQVNSVAISSNGQTLVSGSGDNTIKIWNLTTGKLKTTLTGHTQPVDSVAISPDGQTLVSGSYDHTIKIWNLKTGKLKSTLTGHTQTVNSIAISPDGQTLVSGSYDRTIKIWNLKTGELKATLTGHTQPVNSVAISSDGQIVSGSSDNTIKVWNLATGELKSTFTGHTYPVLSVAISRDGKTLVSGSGDNSIKIWNLTTGELKNTLTGHTYPVLAIAISRDGKTLVSGSGDNSIKIWNLKTGELKNTLTDHTNSVLSVAMSPDGKTVVSGNGDNTINIWRVPQ